MILILLKYICITISGSLYFCFPLYLEKTSNSKGEKTRDIPRLRYNTNNDHADVPESHKVFFLQSLE